MVGCGISTVGITEAGDAINPAGAKGCLSAAAGIVHGIAEATDTTHALAGASLTTIRITAAGHTAIAAVDAEWCIYSTACIIRWVT